MRRCAKCKISKEESEFYINPGKTTRGKWYASYCQKCKSSQGEKIRRQNKERCEEQGIIVDKKKCTLCKRTKPSARFYKNKYTKDGLVARCIPCHKKTVKSNYHSARKHTLRRYGLTIADYEKMHRNQSGRCAVCETDSPGYSRGTSFAVDHNHKTGAVRDLLCRKCNTALGQVDDDILLLEKLIAYIRKHGG